MASNPQKRDYSITGPENQRAQERGLATAEWYTSPIPRQRMKELMKKRTVRNQGHIHLVRFSCCTGLYCLSNMGHMVGVSRLPGIWHPLCDNGRFQVA